MTDQPVRLHRELADLHAYVVPITPKTLREALCVAQTGEWEPITAPMRVTR